MSTVSLNMIVKNEIDPVSNIIDLAHNHFNEINIVVSDKPTANKLTKWYTPFPKVHIKWREWNDRFDQARNETLKMSSTDYYFWLDADDSFDFSVIPELVELADKNAIDAIFLPYNYAQDENGNCITRHWRERLVRADKGFEWRGWVHETLITDEPYTSHKVNAEVKHHTAPDHAAHSLERNHNILKKAYDATKDPRYLMYLGMSEFSLGNYEKTIELLSEYLGVGGSVEDSYRALSMISESAYHLGRHDLALEYASKCITLKPEYPMGYWLLAQYEADQSNWKEALEWVKVAQTKPDPNTLSVYDPSARERAILIAAQAEFMQGNYNNALAWLRKIPNNEYAKELYPDFLAEADAETFTQLLPQFRKFFKSDKQLWEALAPDLAYDKRLQPLRYSVTKPKAWADNTVVILCGQGYEEWGPHTLDKGMGGSEEAVVYLSREFAKLGYEVTVYGEAEVYDLLTEAGPPVDYRPWREFDKRDQFNVFVAWRAPQFVEHVNAKVKLVDLHDVIPAELVKDYPDTLYMVKSQYHRDLYPHLPDEKFRIIGNGIKKDQFHG